MSVFHWSTTTELPSLHFEEFRTVNEDFSVSQCVVRLFHIPKFLFDEGKVQVTIWRRVQEYPLAFSPDYTTVNFEISQVVLESNNSITVIIPLKFANLDSDYNLRAVLRLLVDERSAAEAPTPYCSFATMCGDKKFLAPRPANWFQQTEFIAPALLIPEAREKIDPRALTLINAVTNSMNLTLQNISGIDQSFDISIGLSGHQFRHFMNNLGAHVPHARYLEIGVYYGSTLFSTLYKNSITAVAIDSWDNQLLSYLGDLTVAKESVFRRLPVFAGDTNTVTLIVGDCFAQNTSMLVNALQGHANIYFYDAGHTVYQHFLGLVKLLPVLDDYFVFIVDDWNAQNVQDGTMAAIDLLELRVLLKIEIISSGNPTSNTGNTAWHNGMVAFVLSKENE